MEQTLRRHLGTTADVQEFSQEETENFFLAAKSNKGTDSKVTWQTIRATLLKRMTESKMLSFESKVAVEELPLSVLLKRGWEEAVVRKFPSENSEAHGCELFKVPVRTCTWAEAYERSEATLLEREKAAFQKKRRCIRCMALKMSATPHNSHKQYAMTSPCCCAKDEPHPMSR